MPSPTSSSSAVPMRMSGLRNIDALLGDTRWANTTLSYSFPEVGASWSTSVFGGYGPVSGDGEPWRSAFEPLSGPGAGDDRASFVSALRQWANVADLTFVQVADTATSVGDIRAAYTAPEFQSTTTVAWAYYPGDAPAAGDVWFSLEHVSATDDWTPGSFAFLTVMHELGHALGLKHPFEAAGAAGVTLPQAYDSQTYTIMSYAAGPGDNNTSFSYFPTTPMVLDMTAIQYVYGANTSYHPGDDVYTFNDASTYHQTIWDAGGNDTLDYWGDYPATIDLRAGAGSTLGVPVFVVSHYGARMFEVSNVWIAEGAYIENASGGQADDVLIGNDGANVLDGGAGDDTLDGAGGVDTAAYAGRRASFTLTPTATGFMTHDAQAEGTDQLANIERLQFADVLLAIDLLPDQHAGQALELLGLLAPQLIQSPAAVGTVLARFDAGLSLQDVSQLALDLGLVRSIAGADSNAALAAMAFRNVMGIAPDGAAVDGLVAYLDGHLASYSQAEFLAVAAALEVNQAHIGLVGLQQTGVAYLLDL